MRFGINSGAGIPFYLNGSIAGWVCSSINNTWLVSFWKGSYEGEGFKSRLEAELYLMGSFGE